MTDPIQELLRYIGACDTAQDWYALRTGDSWEDAVKACPDQRWLLWLLGALETNAPAGWPVDFHQKAFQPFIPIIQAGLDEVDAELRRRTDFAALSNSPWVKLTLDTDRRQLFDELFSRMSSWATGKTPEPYLENATDIVVARDFQRDEDAEPVYRALCYLIDGLYPPAGAFNYSALEDAEALCRDFFPSATLRNAVRTSYSEWLPDVLRSFELATRAVRGVNTIPTEGAT